MIANIRSDALGKAMINRRHLLQCGAVSAALLSVEALPVKSKAGSSTQSVPTFGRIKISTVPFDAEHALESATYTPSGKVLVTYGDPTHADRRPIKLATMDDDGGNIRPFFSQEVPGHESGQGLRFMVFADNRRIFLGDFIIECEPSIDDCQSSVLLPVEYPAELTANPHVALRWSEVIVAPDNRHIGWDTLFVNGSALVFVGELKREDAGYKIINTQIVSTLNPFEQDSTHADGVLPQPPRAGEVKQFVHGGRAITMVGAGRREITQSVIQSLATGDVDAITDVPGYTETTIFSPDEHLGITMTARFSPESNLAIVGLMPRPYTDSLNMGLGGLAYRYSVAGVRKSRNGNIGPALIDIGTSTTQPGYMGVNLNTEDDWVYRSPMSWHPDNKKAMWLEGNRRNGRRRIRTVHLPDYRPAAPVAPQVTSSKSPYASTDLSLISKMEQHEPNVDVKVYGRHSGHIEYRRNADVTEKVYVNFSDDGATFYKGAERLDSNDKTRPLYTAKIACSGAHTGKMDVRLAFISAQTGYDGSVGLQFAPDSSGVPMTRGYAVYDGQRLDASALEP